MKKYKNKEWLEEKYISEDLSQTKISEICDVSRPTVSRYVTRYGLSQQDEEICPACGYKSYSLTHHLNKSDECTPFISDYQHQVITGLLMSDGNIQKVGNRNPTFRCTMKRSSHRYLEYLDEEIFPFLGVGVEKVVRSGDKLSRFYTRSNPNLKEYYKWYSTGEKVWPCDDIELTPTTMKHLFVGDGTYNTTTTHQYAVIIAGNEYHRREDVKDMFSALDFGFTINSYYDDEKYNGQHMTIQFTKEGTKELFDYMGEPLPSFEYKWPKYYDYEN
jgi:hypothetical protein